MAMMFLIAIVSFIAGLLLFAAFVNEEEKQIEKTRLFARKGKVYKLTEITSD
jgi:hypothetical protein